MTRSLVYNNITTWQLIIKNLSILWLTWFTVHNSSGYFLLGRGGGLLLGICITWPPKTNLISRPELYMNDVMVHG